jgi:Family of unknown function (DUF5681)
MIDRKRNSQEKLGYGNPPRSGRFQKGKSGNPKGRPKGSRNLATIFRKVIYQKVEIKEGGVKKTVTKFEAVAMQLTNKAAAGDVSAAREIIKWAETMEQVDLKNTPLPSMIVNFIEPKPRKMDSRDEN